MNDIYTGLILKIKLN